MSYFGNFQEQVGLVQAQKEEEEAMADIEQEARKEHLILPTVEVEKRSSSACEDGHQQIEQKTILQTCDFMNMTMVQMSTDQSSPELHP